ncbi:MAG: hypothetical protein IKQ37_11885 [Bacteroidaceae bacterium]|jgi:hypothetical protein|nr:hypothetical protein [Bacteroidaceae bacterium]
MKTSVKIQYFIAVAAFLAAVGFGIAGFIVPPPGEVHDSVLYLIAQFLLLTASILGVGAMFASQKISLQKKLQQMTVKEEKEEEQ